MPEYSGKGIRMNFNGNKPQNMNGYPQQNNYAQGAYPGSYFVQPGGTQDYASSSHQNPPVGNAGFNPGVPGYQPSQTASQGGYPQYFQTQSNPGSFPGAGFTQASGTFSSQGGYSASGNYYSGRPGYQPGYPAPQNPSPAYPGYPSGNPQNGMSGNGGSFIPQTPYSPGYTSPGYEPPVNDTRYQTGYTAYSQMGREPQNTAQAEQFVRQMPLNGGGYVPPPVPVRRRPFELSDPILLLIGAVLLILFIIAVPVMGASQGAIPLKILFVALAAGFTALLWIKPLTAENKRLCFTIVAAALCIAAVVSFISGGNGKNADKTVSRPSGASISITDNISGAGKNSGAQNSGIEQPTAEPASTPAQDDDNKYIVDRVYAFFNAWNQNKSNDMLELCTPSWRSKQENERSALFSSILLNRTPKQPLTFESVSGSSSDTSRQVTLSVYIDYNNRKNPSLIRMTVMLKQENNDWFIDPTSLISFKDVETADPNITPEVQRTEEPPTPPDKVLYYNPDGGKLYHADPNCKSAGKSVLPFKGSFLYSQIGDYPDLARCNVCHAPLRPAEE